MVIYQKQETFLYQKTSKGVGFSVGKKSFVSTCPSWDKWIIDKYNVYLSTRSSNAKLLKTPSSQRPVRGWTMRRQQRHSLLQVPAAAGRPVTTYTAGVRGGHFWTSTWIDPGLDPGNKKTLQIKSPRRVCLLWPIHSKTIEQILWLCFHDEFTRKIYKFYITYKKKCSTKPKSLSKGRWL